MASITVENILELANQLPQLERKKLIAKLNGVEQNGRTDVEYEVPEGRIIRTDAPFVDRTLENEWLKLHEREYIGQWIALKGDRLLAHGPIAKEVFSQARALGVNDALFYLVEDPDLPYVGA
jgi:hypothetical protein